MRPLQVARHVLEVILDNQVSVPELDPPAVLVARICHLVVTVALLRIETQVLRQVEQEGAVVTRCGELGGPAMRGVTTDNEACVSVVLASHRPILVIRLHLQNNDVRLPHQVLLVLESLQHGLNRVSSLPNIALRVNLHWLNPLFNDRIVRQIEIQDDLY